MGEDFFLHPTAEVASDAWLGAGACIWNEVQILSSASVGAETIVGKGVFIDRGVRIGARVKIQNYALLYRGTVVEDEVFVGPHAVITNDKRPRAVNPDGTLKTSADWVIAGSIVRRGASLGAASILLPGVEVGAHAMVGAGALVASDVPPHSLVLGSPARRVGWVCLCGHGLDDGRLSCAVCSRVYQRVGAGLGLAGAPERK
jgi:UDP-2-acetamido-3-amino-2,3-dideoxy-glucuronate N-acetyltransferase